ncbi:MAG: COX15/CtaA family protein [Thermoanaerobaculia bacterium]
MSRDRYTIFAWSVLAYTLAVILWGAFVRASGSGAGCGNHWPLCNGEVLPPSQSTETMIELTHRVMSGLALPLVIVLLVWCFRLHGKRHPARTAAVLAVILMLTEAAIGAGLVLLELVADNDSMARAGWMAGHLGNTLLLLAALVLTAHWGAPAFRPPHGHPPRLRWRGQGRLRRLVLLALAATLLVGVSGAVAALGDTLFPPTSLVDELRQDFSLATNLLKQLRVLHPLIAVGASLILLQLIHAVRRQRPGGDAKRFANRLHLLVFVQLAFGTANILLLAPLWMQLGHLLLADLLWIFLILTCVASLEIRAGSTADAD